MHLLAVIDLPAGNVVEALRAASGGELPNAVLLPEAGASLTATSGSLQAAGLQVLGTSGWSSADIAAPEAAGAWIAAPDPQASVRFSAAYANRFGEAPGMIAGLAYDAMLACLTLARAGNIPRAGLMRPEGFSGVTGMLRFAADMRAERRLAILVASSEGGRSVEGEAMAWA